MFLSADDERRLVKAASDLLNTLRGRRYYKYRDVFYHVRNCFAHDGFPVANSISRFARVSRAGRVSVISGLKFFQDNGIFDVDWSDPEFVAVSPALAFRLAPVSRPVWAE